MGDYNPKDYINDYSWVGEVGNALSAVALKAPDLIKLNKSVHENNKFKDQTYASVSSFIDGLDENDATSIAIAMNLKDESGNMVNAKDLIKKAIPVAQSEETTNQEYGAQLANGFFVPLVQAASKTGISMGKLMQSQLAGNITANLSESVEGKKYAEDQKYTTDRLRSKQEFAERVAPGGELEQETRARAGVEQNISAGQSNPVVRGALALELDQITDLKQQGKVTKAALKYIEDQGNFTKEQRNDLLAMVEARFNEIEQSMLRKRQEREDFAKRREKSNPQISPDKIAQDAQDASNRFIEKQKYLTTISSKEPPPTPEELSAAKEAVKNAEKEMDLYKTIYSKVGEYKDYTFTGYAEAQKEADEEVNKKYFDREKGAIQQTIDAINSGKRMKITGEDIRKASALGRVLNKDDLVSDNPIIQGYNYMKLHGYGDMVEIDPTTNKLKIKGASSSQSQPKFKLNTQLPQANQQDPQNTTQLGEDEAIRQDASGKKWVVNLKTKTTIRPAP